MCARLIHALPNNTNNIDFTDAVQTVPTIYFIGLAGTPYTVMSGFVSGEEFVDKYNSVYEMHTAYLKDAQVKISKPLSV